MPIRSSLAGLVLVSIFGGSLSFSFALIDLSVVEKWSAFIGGAGLLCATHLFNWWLKSKREKRVAERQLANDLELIEAKRKGELEIEQTRKETEVEIEKEKRASKIALIRAQSEREIAGLAVVRAELKAVKEAVDTNKQLLLDTKFSEETLLAAAKRQGLIGDDVMTLDGLRIAPVASRMAVTVLVVEDDTATLRLYDKLFREAGYQVKVATGLQDALFRLPFGVRVVFLDLTLADGPGENLIDHVVTNSLPIKIVVTTGLANSERIEAVRSRVSRIVMKPVAEWNEVFTLIDQSIAGDAMP